MKNKNKNKKYFKQKKKTWEKKDIVLIDGKYCLGPEQEYTLTEHALSHIMSGDFSVSRSKKNGITISEKMLKGGLHTYKGWIQFKKNHTTLSHLKFFDSNIHKYWYYARTLKNDVITLKIPKELFNSKGASSTKNPDVFYKSGYLWKTLFPKDKTKEDILSIIDESLYKLNKEESGKGILIGYALVDHPFTALKVRIQCHGKEIKSAFPTWEQPRTGNTGKSYSHSDTISFIMADSIELFDDDILSCEIPSRLYNSEKGISSLYLNTPSFIHKRPMLNNRNSVDAWKVILQNIGDNENENNIELLKVYFKDPLICKNSFIFQLDAYNKDLINVKKYLKLYNIINITQNIIDIITIVYYYDQKNKTEHFIEIIKYLLLNKTIATAALDNLNNKVINNVIFDFIITYYDNKIIEIYLELLSKSPSRISIYTDFDVINSCYKKELSPLSGELDIIYLTGKKIPLKPKYFNMYLLYMVGESYLLIQNIDKRDKMIKDIIENQGPGFQDMINHFFETKYSEDLEFFAEKFDRLTSKILSENINNINPDTIFIIAKDYFRLQTAQRFKSVIHNPYYGDTNNFENFGTNEYKINLTTKHERITNVLILKMFLEDTIKISKHLGNEEIVKKLSKFKENIWTEKPPVFNNSIPMYIKHWDNQKNKAWLKTVDAELLK